jgi:hypothetical protein
VTDIADVDFGPLAGLVGVWKGDKGIDIAPEPDGSETSPYYETIIFSAVGDVDNAETQNLAVVHYRQIVQRKSNDEVFHDETGYWLWDAGNKLIMHILTIPRGVSVIAGGAHSGIPNADGSTILEVDAALDDPDWQILQSPFMRDNAQTTKFHHIINVHGDRLSYFETTTVDIYGKVFEHTDQNVLTRQQSGS